MTNFEGERTDSSLGAKNLKGKLEKTRIPGSLAGNFLGCDSVAWLPSQLPSIHGVQPVHLSPENPLQIFGFEMNMGN